MKRQKKQAGFTIVEVVLFLAITALFFLIAIFGSGQETQRVQFTQAMDDVSTLIDDIINDVKDGFVTDTGNLSCVDPQPSNPAAPLVIGAGSAGQGERSQCIVLGKVIDFRRDESNKYTLYTVVGRRLDASGDPVKHLVDAKPQVVDSLTFEGELKWGLELYSVWTYTPAYTIGFFHSFDDSVAEIIPVNFNPDGYDPNTLSDTALDVEGRRIVGDYTNYDPSLGTFGDHSSSRMCFRSANEDYYAWMETAFFSRQGSVEITYTEQNSGVPAACQSW